MSSTDENIGNSSYSKFKMPVIPIEYKHKLRTNSPIADSIINYKASTVENKNGNEDVKKDNKIYFSERKNKKNEVGNSTISDIKNDLNRVKKIKNENITFQENKKLKIATKISRCKNFKQSEKTVIGREKEYLEIKKQLETFLEIGTSSILFLTGVPGSGKTYTVMNVLDHIQAMFSYVNTASLKSKSNIYKEIGNGLACKSPIKSLSDLRCHFNDCSKKHIVLIDEIDLLSSKNEKILYNLFELPFFGSSKVFMIVISNTLKKLETKVESRIGKNRMEFVPYKSQQITSILENEDDLKFADKKSIDFVAKKIASSTGDIRKAKEIIAKTGSEDIKSINLFFKEFTTPLIEKFISTMSFYHKILIYLNKKPNTNIKAWFEAHKTFCIIKNFTPLHFCLFQSVLNDLIEYGIYTLKSDKLTVNCNFLEEELDIVTKTDMDFVEFSKGK